MSEEREFYRGLDDDRRRDRQARAVAALPAAQAARDWALAHGLTVRALEAGWWYRHNNRILCWWPSTGRILLSGRDRPDALVRAVGRHDRGDILGRLAAAFPEVVAALRVAP